MPIAATPVTKTYAGTGTRTDFPTGFIFLTADDVWLRLVARDGSDVTADYALALTGGQDEHNRPRHGVVTVAPAPPPGVTVIIVRSEWMVAGAVHPIRIEIIPPAPVALTVVPPPALAAPSPAPAPAPVPRPSAPVAVAPQGPGTAPPPSPAPNLEFVLTEMAGLMQQMVAESEARTQQRLTAVLSGVADELDRLPKGTP